jgi:hypothetical protein
MDYGNFIYSASNAVDLFKYIPYVLAPCGEEKQIFYLPTTSIYPYEIWITANYDQNITNIIVKDLITNNSYESNIPISFIYDTVLNNIDAHTNKIVTLHIEPPLQYKQLFELYSIMLPDIITNILAYLSKTPLNSNIMSLFNLDDISETKNYLSYYFDFLINHLYNAMHGSNCHAYSDNIIYESFILFLITTFIVSFIRSYLNITYIFSFIIIIFLFILFYALRSFLFNLFNFFINEIF